MTKVRLRVSLILILTCVLCAAHSASAETTVLKGEHVVVFDIVNANPAQKLERPPDYANATYSQKVLSEDQWSIRVRVEITKRAISNDTPFPMHSASLPAAVKKSLRPESRIQADDPRIASKAREVTAGATTAVEAIDAVANWVHDHVTYTIPVEQDALSVFSSGKGSCQGYTRLSIAMLRAVGIPARYAHGYLVSGQGWGAQVERYGVKTSGGGYHAWYEVYIPGDGWYYTDGEYTKYFVDPYHLTRWIDDERSTPMPTTRKETIGEEDPGITITRAVDTDTTIAIDEYPEPHERMMGLATRGQQTSVVWGYLTGPDGQPVADAQAIRWSKPDAAGRMKGIPEDVGADGRYAIVGLSPGTTRISFRAKGYQEKVLNVSVGARDTRRKDVTLSR